MVVTSGDQQGMKLPDDPVSRLIKAVGRQMDVVRFAGLPRIGGPDLGMEDDDPRKVLIAGPETVELFGFQPGEETCVRGPERSRFSPEIGEEIETQTAAYERRFQSSLGEESRTVFEP